MGVFVKLRCFHWPYCFSDSEHKQSFLLLRLHKEHASGHWHLVAIKCRLWQRRKSIYPKITRSFVCVACPLGLHPGGAPQSHNNPLHPHLPPAEQVSGDHRLLPQLHRRRGGGGRHMLLRTNGHQAARQPPGIRSGDDKADNGRIECVIMRAGEKLHWCWCWNLLFQLHALADFLKA